MKLEEVTMAPDENVQDTLARFEKYLETASIEDIRQLAKAIQYSDKLARKWGLAPKKTLGPRRTSVVRNKQQEPAPKPVQKQSRVQRFKNWIQKK